MPHHHLTFTENCRLSVKWCSHTYGFYYGIFLHTSISISNEFDRRKRRRKKKRAHTHAFGHAINRAVCVFMLEDNCCHIDFRIQFFFSAYDYCMWTIFKPFIWFVASRHLCEINNSWFEEPAMYLQFCTVRSKFTFALKFPLKSRYIWDGCHN